MGKGQKERREAAANLTTVVLTTKPPLGKSPVTSSTPQINTLKVAVPVTSSTPQINTLKVAASAKSKQVEEDTDDVDISADIPETNAAACNNLDLFTALTSEQRFATLNKIVAKKFQKLNISDAASNSKSLKLSKSMNSLNSFSSIASTQSLSNQTDGQSIKSSSSMDDMASLAGGLEDADVEAPVDFGRIEYLQVVQHYGINSNEGFIIISSMVQFIQSNQPLYGLQLLESFIKHFKSNMEPFALSVLPQLLTYHADKTAAIRELSSSLANNLMGTICPQACRLVMPILLTHGIAEGIDWRIKVGALSCLKVLSPRASMQISPLLPVLVPRLSECITDSKKQIATAAMETMLVVCATITNEDIVHLVPQLVRVIAHPEESAKTLDGLMETTFVSNVDCATLSLISPLLVKCLRDVRSVSVVKRKCARVIDNMCRLVERPEHVTPFLPTLLPALEKVIDEVVDLEVCEVAKAARGVLLKAVGEGKQGSASFITPDVVALEQVLMECFVHSVTLHHHEMSTLICRYIAKMVTHLIAFGPLTSTIQWGQPDAWRHAVSASLLKSWATCIEPFVQPLIFHCVEDVTVEMVTRSLRAAALGEVPDAQIPFEPDDSCPILDIEFSLAFGGKILLHNTGLKLVRGRRYAVMGQNGAGKTTLMKNIGTGNIEGLPDTLRTVYVQHDEASVHEAEELPMIDDTMRSDDVVKAGVLREDAVRALQEINFTPEMLSGPKAALSGGWKMKLLIVKAMLCRADVLLLDEPTNHLDVKAVAWLVSYLQAQRNITVLIVSHDPAFLDLVVTDVIHFEQKKLVYYRGSLKDFVDLHPEAAYYYELTTSTMEFKFPVPERLEGISSTTRSILKADNVTYTYPGRDKPGITNATVKICLASRIAVKGPNGAGKSTLIKLLAQETEPDVGPEGVMGEVWKHHNLRVAYVAQHSFYHVEKHLDTSPVEYIKWRFSDGVDREDFAKSKMKLTEDEEKRELKWGDVDQVLGRRKNGRTMEYECTYMGQGNESFFINGRMVEKKQPNKYYSLETMLEMGLEKLVLQCDTRTAAMAAGLDIRPLLNKEVQTHLDDFNLEAEFGTHGKIRLLSGGQKVKLVLAAAMWNKPHLIILDEPTNYLDREALGALTRAIQGFHGGVVIISHNGEFTDAVCTENWVVENGVCTVDGEAAEVELKSSSGSMRKIKSASTIEDKTVEDKAGNTNKTKAEFEAVMNPRTLVSLTKVEIRKLTKLAQVAGMTMKDYVAKINKNSPEWKWLADSR